MLLAACKRSRAGADACRLSLACLSRLPSIQLRKHRLWIQLPSSVDASSRMRDLSAPVALSRKITGDDRHRWSYIYVWTSDQGLEWALKPPLQSLCGWRRNAQTCRQLVERPAFVGFHCAGGSSVEQDSPAEPKMVARAALLVENGPGPAKSRPRGKKPPPHQRNPGCRGKKSPGMARTNHPRCVVR